MKFVIVMSMVIAVVSGIIDLEIPKVVESYAYQEIGKDCLGEHVVKKIKQYIAWSFYSCHENITRIDHYANYDKASDWFSTVSGFHVPENKRYKRSSAIVRPDQTTVRDLIIREAILDQRFQKYECVLDTYFDKDKKDTPRISPEFINELDINNNLKEDLKQSLDDCIDYGECIMESFNDKENSAFPKQLRHAYEISKCVQKQTRVNCIKNGLREVFYESDNEDSSEESRLEDDLSVVMEIAVLLEDSSSFELLL